MHVSTRAKKLLVRTLRTMVQTAAGILATAGMFGELDWRMLLSTTILAGVCCVLMNLEIASDRKS